MARLTARRIALAARIVTGAALGATLLASTAASWWVGDLAVHFRLQYAAAALGALVVLTWVRRWAWAAAALLVLVVNGITTASVLRADSLIQDALAGPDAITRRQTVRIASINVLFHNTHYDRVIELLRDARPDAAVLVEITPRWRAALGSLRDEFPYQSYAEGQDSHGTLLLSHWPLEHLETVEMGPHADPTIVASLDVHGRTLHLIGAHPSWPIGPAVSAERNRELQTLAALAQATAPPLVMAGDFNVTPFSPHFRAFLAQSGLEWAAQGAGWQPTWPTFLPIAGIQIDHAFVSPTVVVHRFERGPRIGSDHWPILVALDW